MQVRHRPVYSHCSNWTTTAQLRITYHNQPLYPCHLERTCTATAHRQSEM